MSGFGFLIGGDFRIQCSDWEFKDGMATQKVTMGPYKLIVPPGFEQALKVLERERPAPQEGRKRDE